MREIKQISISPEDLLNGNLIPPSKQYKQTITITTNMGFKDQILSGNEDKININSAIAGSMNADKGRRNQDVITNIINQ